MPRTRARRNPTARSTIRYAVAYFRGGEEVDEARELSLEQALGRIVAAARAVPAPDIHATLFRHNKGRYDDVAVAQLYTGHDDSAAGRLVWSLVGGRDSHRGDDL